jgi:hypothetical protein
VIDKNHPDGNFKSSNSSSLTNSLCYHFFMKRIRFGNGFAVFILFFGIALLDALHKFDWLRIVFWLATGFVFIVADNLKRPARK